jgi:uncharacterized membrane protein YdbT with pleckstrin-like domain
LTEGERPVWYGRESYKSHVGAFAFGFCILAIGILFFLIPLIGVFFGAIFIAFALIDWLYVYLSVVSSEYFISNKRVFVKHGLVGRASQDLKMEWVTGTVLRQGFMGRMLNYGSMMFTGVGTSTNVSMVGVPDVLSVKGIVENTLQDNRRRTEVEQKMRRLQEEYDFGRLDASKYQELKRAYEAEGSRV